MFCQILLAAPDRFPRVADHDRAARARAAWVDAARGTHDSTVTDATAALIEMPEARALLDGVLGGSPFLGHCLAKEPAFAITVFKDGPDAAFERLISGLGAGAQDDFREAELMRSLRAARRRAALLTALADLSQGWTLEQTTASLSAFACAATRAATRALLAAAYRSGALAPSSGWAGGDDCQIGSGFAVLGMGKLGACELNYSSDIDLILLFDPERVEGPSGGDPRQALQRIGRGLVRLLGERTADGFVQRVDLRLRPDPGATPIVVNMDSALRYYESVGQNWERAAMIKAWPVAGDFATGHAFRTALEPFIWRRHLDFAAIEDIKSVKRQIHAHKGGSRIALAGHDIKVGRGGIREIEFFAQTQQLIYGGRDANLRMGSTVRALDALRDAGHVRDDTVDGLTDAYRLLRTIEHRLQMVNDQQTQTLPSGDADLDSLALFSGYDDRAALETRLLDRLRFVEDRYARLFEQSAPLGINGADIGGSLVFTGTADDPETLETLRRLGFSAPDAVTETVRAWHRGRLRATRSERARQILTELMPRLLSALGETAEPDAAFRRFDTFLAAMPAGIQLFSLFRANPPLLDLVAEIMGAAPAMADHLAETPSLLEAVLAQGFHDQLPSAPSLAAELGAKLDRARDQQDVLDLSRTWVNDHRFQVEVQVFQGLLDGYHAGGPLADIADAVLAKIVPDVCHRFAFDEGFGLVPRGSLAVLALGRLGSREMTPTSDLDLMFVYDVPLDGAPEDEIALVMSDGARPLSAPVYFQRLAQRIITALTAKTGTGHLYEIDTRLRPSGNAGPIATSLAAFRRYYGESAWTWEVMALTRARVVGGDFDFGARLEEQIRVILTADRDPGAVMADALDMRRRLQRDKPGKGIWDLKMNPGGLVDLEFIAQTHQLRAAPRDPLVLCRDTVGTLRALAARGHLRQDEADPLIDACILFQRLLWLIRLTGKPTAGCPAAVRERLAKAGDSVDFADLEANITTAMARTRARFEGLIGPLDPPNDGTAPTTDSGRSKT